MTLTDSEIEAKAREWRDVWCNYPHPHEESWQALVRHVMAHVGTIVVGEGLTAAQEAWPADTKLEEAVRLETAQYAVEAFIWDDTAETHNFWSAINTRLESMAAALRASAAVQPREPVTVGDITIKQLGSYDAYRDRVAICRSYSGDTFLTPTDTRALAAALIAAADAAEGRAAP
jgi:hypothetical protein